MKPFAVIAALSGSCVSFACAESTPANGNHPASNSPALEAVAPGAQSSGEMDSAALEKRIQPILAALKPGDPAKEASAREILAAHFQVLKAWHEKNDAQLKELWNQFNKARSDKDQAKADGALSQIDNVYATFKPEHDKLLNGLAACLTPEQIETVEDVLTVNKVKVTFNAYVEIFHGLTDAQKAVILKNLKAAREEAIDAGSMTEKSAFFKKYKIKIEEDYLTSQGYDPKQARQDFAAKQKAEVAAKKSSAKSDSKESDQAEDKN
jgi:hypothetical protein